MKTIKSVLPKLDFNLLVKRRRLISIAVVFITAVAGTTHIFFSAASTFVISIQPEKGTMSGNAVLLHDGTASDGSAVRFRPAPIAGNAPWGSSPLYVDPNNSASTYVQANPGVDGATQLTRLGKQPVSSWFGGWNGDVRADADAYVSRAATAGAIPVLVAYNIPNRDCGGHSGGGVQTESEYMAWIQNLANGIGSRPAIVILEPDAIPLTSCLTSEQQTARYRMLSQAVITFKSKGPIYVYIDAGHSSWLTASDVADRLRKAGADQAAGFALNVSNFRTTSESVAYGNQVSGLLNGQHYVVDTARNGNGPTSDSQWCNPPGRALGNTPTTTTGSTAADAFLWIKIPWESDGPCNGGPSAGQPFWAYAVDLARAAGW